MDGLVESAAMGLPVLGTRTTVDVAEDAGLEGYGGLEW